MGAELYYKTKNKTKKLRNAVDAWLVNDKENLILKGISSGIGIYTEEDVLWAENEDNEYLVDYFKNRLGEGSIKTSGGLTEEGYEAGYDEEDILAMQTSVFVRLNAALEDPLFFYSGSCSLTVTENYFSCEQMKMFTKDGKLISSKHTKKGRELYAFLSEDVKCVA